MGDMESLIVERITALQKALRDIANLPDPLNSKHAAQAQCDFLKGVAREALEVDGARGQLAWMDQMERIEQEVFPDARPRSEVVVEVERPHPDVERDEIAHRAWDDE